MAFSQQLGGFNGFLLLPYFLNFHFANVPGDDFLRRFLCLPMFSYFWRTQNIGLGMGLASGDIVANWPEEQWPRLMRCRLRFGING